ncbi:MAG: ParB N-terminal domain-containing protein [Desulfamplus sp.]|nr:ParB N-terminal domain-containing protein [Desulfamplus sp.]
MNYRKGLCVLGLSKIDVCLEPFRKSKANVIEKMKASLQAKGQLTPVMVVESDNILILVDGFKRYNASMALGRKEINAVVVESDLTRAKAMIYTMNRASGFTVIQEGHLCRALVEKDGLTQNEAAVLLDRHKSWVSRRIDLIRRLNPGVVSDIELELIPPGSGVSLARLPFNNQADFSAIIQTHKLSSESIQRLVDMWCKAHEPEIKQFIMQSPQEALKIVKNVCNQKKKSLSDHLQSLKILINTIEKVVDLERKTIGNDKCILLDKCVKLLKSGQSGLESYWKGKHDEPTQ